MKVVCSILSIPINVSGGGQTITNTWFTAEVWLVMSYYLYCRKSNKIFIRLHINLIGSIRLTLKTINVSLNQQHAAFKNHLPPFGLRKSVEEILQPRHRTKDKHGADKRESHENIFTQTHAKKTINSTRIYLFF